MRYIVEANQVNKFKYCPYCGSDTVYIYDGDFMGQTECLNCDKSMEFLILEEMRERNLEQFKKVMMK